MYASVEVFFEAFDNRYVKVQDYEKYKTKVYMSGLTDKVAISKRQLLIFKTKLDSGKQLEIWEHVLHQQAISDNIEYNRKLEHFLNPPPKQ